MFIFRLFIAVILLVAPLALLAQKKSAHARIDSLVKTVPALMRGNEPAARPLVDELFTLSTQYDHQHGLIQSLFFKAWLNYRHQPAHVAIDQIDSVLNHVNGIASDSSLVNFYILKGQCYVKKLQFAQALENFKKALSIAESRNDQASRTSTMVSIGWAYMEDGKPAEAIRFFEEVLRIHPGNDYPHRPLLLCNIAACYNTMGQFKKAEEFALKGIEAARSRQSNGDHANGLNILARSYSQQGKIEEAISVTKEASVIREKVADPSMLASDYLQLADLYMKNAEPQRAIVWAKKSEDLSHRYNNNLKLAGAYESLYQAYEAVGDHQNAFAYLKKLAAHKDSLADDQYNQAFAEMQARFETQKKTAENLQLKQDKLEADLHNRKQQNWLIALGAGFSLLLASGIYISKLMKSRYRAKLAEENASQQKKRTLAVMEAEEKERRRIAADLHDGVGQTLAAASMQLTKAINGKQALNKVDELIAQAGTEVRSLSHQVTPELLLHYGLVQALQQGVDRLNDANSHVVFNLYTHLEKEPDDKMIELTLYRCFQELTTNILKHAHASEVNIQLNCFAGEAELVIEDNGRGFDSGSQQQGLGLKNIESRVAMFDGEMNIDSTPGKGTTTIIRLKQTAPEMNI